MFSNVFHFSQFLWKRCCLKHSGLKVVLKQIHKHIFFNVFSHIRDVFKDVCKCSKNWLRYRVSV